MCESTTTTTTTTRGVAAVDVALESRTPTDSSSMATRTIQSVENRTYFGEIMIVQYAAPNDSFSVLREVVHADAGNTASRACHSFTNAFQKDTASTSREAFKKASQSPGGGGGKFREGFKPFSPTPHDAFAAREVFVERL